MIKKTLLWALLWVGLFVGLMQLMRPQWQDAATQYRMHFERTQTLVQATTPWDTVWVGSSLVATTAIYGLVPTSWYSLGLRGGTAHTGAWVCLSCAPPPKLLIIETNLLLMAPDTIVYASACGFPQRFVRRLFAFREVARPATIFQLGLQKLASQFINSAGGQALTPLDKNTQELLKSKQIQSYRHELADFSRKWQKSLAFLRQWVAMARQQGTEVVFVAFPEPNIPGVASRERVIRAQLKRDFPEIPCFYMEHKDDLRFPDLAHMDFPSTQIFMKAFLPWVRGLPQATPAASTTPGRP
jgi:hypothetical protein